MFEVFFGGGIEFLIKTILCLKRPAFAFADVAHFKPAAHGRVHHDLARRLHFLKAVERDVVEVAGAVEVALLVAHDLLEQVVSAGLPLLLLEQQVVS